MNSLYASSNYLIYSSFERNMTENKDSSIICGSILIDCAQTEEEANDKIAMYKVRSEQFYTKFPLSKQMSRHHFIKNQKHWWRS